MYSDKAGAKREPWGPNPQIDIFGPQLTNLFFSRKRLLCLILDFAPFPSDERLAPLRRLLCRRLCLEFLYKVPNNVLDNISYFNRSDKLQALCFSNELSL